MGQPLLRSHPGQELLPVARGDVEPGRASHIAAAACVGAGVAVWRLEADEAEGAQHADAGTSSCH